MSAWTEGPWQWVKKDGGYYDLENPAGRFVADDGSAGDEYGRSIDPEDMGESGANARLIAAAPAMADYIIARAEAGDLEAQRIVAAFHEPARAALSLASGGAK